MATRLHPTGPASSERDAGPSIDPALFRSVLGHFCSGVTVIAAADAGQPLGVTCQSFAALSLDPPLVLFCPARTSTTWPRIRKLGKFCVTVLAEEHDEVSARMSRSGTEKFVGLEFDLSPLGAPRLAGGAAWLDCTVHAEYDGGDHTIVAAAVHGLAAAHDRQPLLFHRGGYARLAVSEAT